MFQLSELSPCPNFDDKPLLRKWPYGFADTLGDDPDAHRWRAQWDAKEDGTVIGIALVAYPVMRKTPTGAWIDPRAYAHSTWVTSDNRKAWRWVSNDGAQAWAKPTQQQAIHSIGVRLTRWASHLNREVNKARGAARTLYALYPDMSNMSECALSYLDM